MKTYNLIKRSNLKVIKWTQKKEIFLFPNRINSWNRDTPERNHVSGWTSSKVVLHFSRLNNNKMAYPVGEGECVFKDRLGNRAPNDVHLTVTQQLFLLPFTLQWKETEGGVLHPETSIFLSSLAHIDWQPLTSHFPPFDLYIQDVCFLGYMSGYVSLVELMSLDHIKTVLHWYKHNRFQIQ